MRKFVSGVFLVVFIYGFATSPIANPVFNIGRGIGLAIPFAAIGWIVWSFMDKLRGRRAVERLRDREGA
jgi:hypothetical protein